MTTKIGIMYVLPISKMIFDTLIFATYLYNIFYVCVYNFFTESFHSTLQKLLQVVSTLTTLNIK